MATAVSRTDSRNRQLDIQSAIGDVSSAFFDTSTIGGGGGSVTLVALDALAGPISDICIQFLLDNDVAATFTPAWYVTSIDAPLTFVVQNIPAIAVIATPANDGVYRYEFPGVLAEGMQLEFRIAQDAAGGVQTIEGDISYRS